MYWKSLISSKFSFLTLSFQSSLSRNDEFFKFFFQISTNLSKFKPSPFISYSIFLCKSAFWIRILKILKTNRDWKKTSVKKIGRKSLEKPWKFEKLKNFKEKKLISFPVIERYGTEMKKLEKWSLVHLLISSKLFSNSNGSRLEKCRYLCQFLS